MTPRRLTAFEFVAATDAPQLVRLSRQGVVLLQFCVLGWLAVDLSALLFGMGIDYMEFAKPDDLTIEGQGIGRPYWDGEEPPWAVAFGPAAEQCRIEAIRRAAYQHAQRGGSLLTM